MKDWRTGWIAVRGGRGIGRLSGRWWYDWLIVEVGEAVEKNKVEGVVEEDATGGAVEQGDVEGAVEEGEAEKRLVVPLVVIMRRLIFVR